MGGVVSSYLTLLPVLIDSITAVYSVAQANILGNNVTVRLQHSCIILLNSNYPTQGDLKAEVEHAFRHEQGVFIQAVHIQNLTWEQSHKAVIPSVEENREYRDIPLFYLPKKVTDRACLYIPDHQLTKPYEPPAVAYTGSGDVQSIVSYINLKCEVYRDRSGRVTNQGLHREYIESDLFHVKGEVPGALTFHDMVKENEDLKCEQLRGGEEYCFKGQQEAVRITNHCSEVTLEELTSDMFKSDYLFRSKPVIIRGAVRSWPAVTKWSISYLNSKFGNNTVHIKLAEGGRFEGVDLARRASNYDSFQIPQRVWAQLPYPDLIVVRPAVLNVNFSDFLNLMNSTVDTNISAYLEYSSIPQYLPELEHDVAELPFIQGLLQKKHTNAWLSNGHTLGKLHFDPFDNILCQIRGRKELTLFEPHDNTQLYEAHIPEALLHFNATSKMFEEPELVDSTAMVMSPIDLEMPDFSRFPKLAETHPLNCTIDEGDALYLPSFWWHEVQSYPAQDERRNMAVNFWYEPFLAKEFPCPQCSLHVNAKYRELL